MARVLIAERTVVVADLHRENVDTAAEVMRNAGSDASTATVDVSARESVHELVGTATFFGDVTGVTHAAGAHQPGSPCRALALVAGISDRPRGPSTHNGLDPFLAGS